MVARIIFGVASILFLVSLFVPSVMLGEDKSLTGLETFVYTLRYGTANIVGAGSIADFLVNFIALVAAAANFVFVFWAMLVFAPTRITALKWFWWVSLLFLMAAAYTGVQAALSEQVTLQYGYFYWTGALTLMLLASCISRAERVLKRLLNRRKVQESRVTNV